MKMLLPLASLLGIEVESLIERIKKNAVALVVMALFSMIALTFGLVAANNAMVAWLGPIWGPLAIAGVALVIVLIFYLMTQMAQRRRRRQQLRRRRSNDTTSLMTTAALTAAPMLLSSPLIRRLGIPLGGAAAVYFLLTRNRSGSSPDIRTDTEDFDEPY